MFNKSLERGYKKQLAVIISKSDSEEQRYVSGREFIAFYIRKSSE